MTTIRFTEQAAADPLLFSAEELEQIKQLRSILQPGHIDAQGRPKVQCCRYLHIGLFFDGTNNNKYIAQKGHAHSNVARLYELFPCTKPVTIKQINGYTNDGLKKFKRETISTEEDDTPFPKLPVFTGNQEYFQKVYIPGVGTPFPDVGDLNKNTFLGLKLLETLSENTLDDGMADQGDARIFWAIWQVVSILLSVKKTDHQKLDAATIIKSRSFCHEFALFIIMTKQSQSSVFFQAASKFQFPPAT